jgi:deoxyribonuclease IV
MDRLYFGTGGTPHSTAKPANTLKGIERVAELGLGCTELEFVRQVMINEAGARLVAETAKKVQVKLSAHSSYYINLNAREPEKLAASQKRLLHAARIAYLCGAQSVVLHTAFYLGDPPETVFETVKKNLKEVLDTMREENVKITIRPELMGRLGQFGTLDEILRLSAELEGAAPCVDLAHWHARTGAFNTYPEFMALFNQIKDTLGKPALADMHIHFSGINYTKNGERNHLNLKESDLNYVDLLKALRDSEVKGLVICESPNLEEDAVLLQETYSELVKSGK